MILLLALLSLIISVILLLGGDIDNGYRALMTGMILLLFFKVSKLEESLDHFKTENMDMIKRGLFLGTSLNAFVEKEKEKKDSTSSDLVVK